MYPWSGKSPTITFLLSFICNPANTSERVSFKAKETAKPPTPKAVINGVSEDLFNRGYKFEVIKIDRSFPEYVYKNTEKFKNFIYLE